MPQIPDSLREQVSRRAKGLCEYCHARQEILIRLEVDHIIPLSQGGATTLDNLCLSCRYCNGYKQKYQTGVDPKSGDEVALFNPRMDLWRVHFQWDGDAVQLVGLTPTGRSTIARLRLNRDEVLLSRRIWADNGWHPPPEDIH